VKAIKGRLVLIGFDGWEDEKHDHLYDYRSEQMFPCGWGEMVGHALQKPVRTNPIEEEEEVVDEEEELVDEIIDVETV
ncbi:hypothetical protein PMAYCL1PPCAC_01704, partial [Pristionchus mayeri]